jgi:hypothetical protein
MVTVSLLAYAQVHGRFHFHFEMRLSHLAKLRLYELFLTNLRRVCAP